MFRPLFVSTLFFYAVVAPISEAAAGPVYDARSIDGTGNNLGNTLWGSAGTALNRSSQTPTSSGAYYPGDGSGSTFYGGPGSGTSPPNAREISNVLNYGHGKSKYSRRRLTDMSWQWGQFLDHDITLVDTSSLPSEFAPIAVDAGDPLSPMIPFSRSLYDTGTGTSASNPRQQTNAITSYIDGSNVYGSDTTRANALRTFSGGRLKSSAGDLLPFNTPGLPNAGGTSPTMFLAGDARANEQVGLTAMHTLFMREHNRLADVLETENPGWNDEQLYQTSRKIVGAEMQAITYGEFLPALLGKRSARQLAAKKFDYDPTLDATVSNEFASSIYRFGHSMLPEKLKLARVRDSQRDSISLADAFFDPTFIASDATGATRHVDQLLLGLSRSVSQEIDVKVTDAVRNFLFGAPGSGGMDLMALNIQRGREHGMPSYNDMRVHYGLSPVASFADVTNNRKTRKRLSQLYGSVDDIDSWVGALAEDHVRGGSVGELVRASMIQEFSKLRDGDHYFYMGDPELMDNSAIDAVIDLESVRLSDIIAWNTDAWHVPGDVFRTGRGSSWGPSWGPDWDSPWGGSGFGNVPEPTSWVLAITIGTVGLAFRPRRVSSHLG